MNNNEYDDNTLRIPVEPVPLPCDECKGENYPNYRYELVGMSGVLCKPCLNKELATINAALSSEQEDKGYDTDFLEAIKPENWTRTSGLHTPTADVSILETGNVQFTLPDSQFELSMQEVDALVRYLFRESYQLPTIVCLVGSTSEPDAFRLANLQETKKLNIVLSIGIDTKSDADLLVTGEITAEDKARLDGLHLRKIDLADEVLVVSRHIGESTRAEIAYAESHSKPVRYVYPENDPLEKLRPKRVDTEQG
jgi:hypothetical protein